jgi:hypothetical protein
MMLPINPDGLLKTNRVTCNQWGSSGFGIFFKPLILNCLPNGGSKEKWEPTKKWQNEGCSQYVIENKRHKK